MPNEIVQLKELSQNARIEWKRIFIVFISAYGIFWSFLEPLNLFGVGSNLWSSLGGWGYVALFAVSSGLSVLVEFSRILSVFIAINNQVRRLQENHIQQFKLIGTFDDLINENLSIVRNAQEILAITGSRARDPNYLQAIEQKLVATPNLTHIRVLIGSPHHQIFKDHLLNLLKIRNCSVAKIT